ncbi:Mucin-like not chitinase - possible cell wall mannoprotein [Scheffersomyces stipitis CBS 6054]|uniref:Mucin-like not chitinase-possible cell wall mannoprotein n=1 Tax=Scheffersomyces stipitis (strain ATCC 58785 / CBS 6054 / NBRC 10063 / NRRL Y-11545) TaxID=322104 RepID=A3GHE1_PICST|nr:Mucin-like not chitinase - possible cell wall mannoprotein [Scheffersomyces stipitis CBS 6054]EAZ62803.2 Mucin-like not chitinase - possible cell wall mannoprotein [Scheffersomyces stipitis CBS 6054]
MKFISLLIPIFWLLALASCGDSLISFELRAVFLDNHSPNPDGFYMNYYEGTGEYQTSTTVYGKREDKTEIQPLPTSESANINKRTPSSYVLFGFDFDTDVVVFTLDPSSGYLTCNIAEDQYVVLDSLMGLTLSSTPQGGFSTSVSASDQVTYLSLDGSIYFFSCQFGTTNSFTINTFNSNSLYCGSINMQIYLYDGDEPTDTDHSTTSSSSDIAAIPNPSTSEISDSTSSVSTTSISSTASTSSGSTGSPTATPIPLVESLCSFEMFIRGENFDDVQLGMELVDNFVVPAVGGSSVFDYYYDTTMRVGYIMVEGSYPSGQQVYDEGPYLQNPALNGFHLGSGPMYSWQVNQVGNEFELAYPWPFYACNYGDDSTPFTLTDSEQLLEYPLCQPVTVILKYGQLSSTCPPTPSSVVSSVESESHSESVSSVSSPSSELPTLTSDAPTPGCVEKFDADPQGITYGVMGSFAIATVSGVPMFAVSTDGVTGDFAYDPESSKISYANTYLSISENLFMTADDESHAVEGWSIVEYNGGHILSFLGLTIFQACSIDESDTYVIKDPRFNQDGLICPTFMIQILEDSINSVCSLDASSTHSAISSTPTESFQLSSSSELPIITSGAPTLTSSAPTLTSSAPTLTSGAPTPGCVEEFDADPQGITYGVMGSFAIATVSGVPMFAVSTDGVTGDFAYDPESSKISYANTYLSISENLFMTADDESHAVEGWSIVEYNGGHILSFLGLTIFQACSIDESDTYVIKDPRFNQDGLICPTFMIQILEDSINSVCSLDASSTHSAISSTPTESFQLSSSSELPIITSGAPTLTSSAPTLTSGAPTPGCVEEFDADPQGITYGVMGSFAIATVSGVPMFAVSTDGVTGDFAYDPESSKISYANTYLSISENLFMTADDESHAVEGWSIVEYNGGHILSFLGLTIFQACSIDGTDTYVMKDPRFNQDGLICPTFMIQILEDSINSMCVASSANSEYSSLTSLLSSKFSSISSVSDSRGYISSSSQWTSLPESTIESKESTASSLSKLTSISSVISSIPTPSISTSVSPPPTDVFKLLAIIDGLLAYIEALLVELESGLPILAKREEVYILGIDLGGPDVVFNYDNDTGYLAADNGLYVQAPDPVKGIYLGPDPISGWGYDENSQLTFNSQSAFFRCPYGDDGGFVLSPVNGGSCVGLQLAVELQVGSSSSSTPSATSSQDHTSTSETSTNENYSSVGQTESQSIDSTSDTGLGYSSFSNSTSSQLSVRSSVATSISTGDIAVSISTGASASISAGTSAGNYDTSLGMSTGTSHGTSSDISTETTPRSSADVNSSIGNDNSGTSSEGDSSIVSIDFSSGSLQITDSLTPSSIVPTSSVPASSIPASSVPASSIPASSVPASSVPVTKTTSYNFQLTAIAAPPNKFEELVLVQDSRMILDVTTGSEFELKLPEGYLTVQSLYVHADAIGFYLSSEPIGGFSFIGDPILEFNGQSDFYICPTLDVPLQLTKVDPSCMLGSLSLILDGSSTSIAPDENSQSQSVANINTLDSSSSLTTATLLTSEVITITDCPSTITNCPLESIRTVTIPKTLVTTYCPVSGSQSMTISIEIISTEIVTLTKCPSSVTNCPVKTTELTTNLHTMKTVSVMPIDVLTTFTSVETLACTKHCLKSQLPVLLTHTLTSPLGNNPQATGGSAGKGSSPTNTVNTAAAGTGVAGIHSPGNTISEFEPVSSSISTSMIVPSVSLLSQNSNSPESISTSVSVWTVEALGNAADKLSGTITNESGKSMVDHGYLDELKPSDGLIILQAYLNRRSQEEILTKPPHLREELMQINSLVGDSETYSFEGMDEDSDDEIIKMMLVLMEYKKTSGKDGSSYEAGFQIDMSPSYGWASSSVTPVSRVTGKSENRTVMGAVNSKGIVQLNLKKPFRNVAKKRKTASARRDQANEDRDESVGTTTGHFKYFVLDVLSTLDLYPEYRNCYLIMDNASVHKNHSI